MDKLGLPTFHLFHEARELFRYILKSSERRDVSWRFNAVMFSDKALNSVVVDDVVSGGDFFDDFDCLFFGGGGDDVAPFSLFRWDRSFLDVVAVFLAVLDDAERVSCRLDVGMKSVDVIEGKPFLNSSIVSDSAVQVRVSVLVELVSDDTPDRTWFSNVELVEDMLFGKRALRVGEEDSLPLDVGVAHIFSGK